MTKEGAGGVSKSTKLPILFALDQDWKTAQSWIERLSDEVWGFKVGSILYTEQGPECVRVLKRRNLKVFLDLKFHDIPNTVKGAVKAAFEMGVDLVTVHAAGGRAMLESIAPLQNEHQHLLAISVLTSLEEKDQKDLGWSRSLPQQVSEMSKLAVDSGIHGLVSSPLEVSQLRRLYPKQILVTPGVRSQKTGTGDQKRTGTAAEVLEAGSNFIVLGRALSEAKDWQTEWREIKSTLAGKY